MSRRLRTEQRRRPVRGGARETVRAIMTAAERLLRQGGFTHLTTNRVAEVAGASIGSLYQYFASKDALVAALVDRRIEEQMTLIARKLDELEGLPLERALEAFADELIQLYARRPEVDSLLLSLVGRVERREAMLAAERAAVDMLSSHLRARGARFARPDIDLAAFVMVHSLQAVVSAAAAHAPERLRSRDFQVELTRELTALAMGYLAPEPM
jgi:AcrR family transcriptional regulator